MNTVDNKLHEEYEDYINYFFVIEEEYPETTYYSANIYRYKDSDGKIKIELAIEPYDYDHFVGSTTVMCNICNDYYLAPSADFHLFEEHIEEHIESLNVLGLIDLHFNEMDVLTVNYGGIVTNFSSDGRIGYFQTDLIELLEEHIKCFIGGINIMVPEYRYIDYDVIYGVDKSLEKLSTMLYLQ
jgi:hypothetical protein